MNAPNLAVVPQQQRTASIEKAANNTLIKGIDDILRISKILSQSGFFSDAKSEAQCAVKVLAGHEMGFKAFQSMTGIHIIQGKPTVGAGLMAARIKSSGKYDYIVLEQTDQVCSICVFEIELKEAVNGLRKRLAAGNLIKDEFLSNLQLLALGISTFTIEEARKAQTKNLDKFPKNMLFARAVSNAVKWYCPDVFDCSVYTPEELGAEVDESGYIINEPAVVTVTPVHTPVQSQEASTPQNGDRKYWENQVLVEIGNRGWDIKNPDTQTWLKQEMMSKYSKDVRAALSIGQLQEFCEFIKNYQAQQSYDYSTIDVDAQQSMA